MSDLEAKLAALQRQVGTMERDLATVARQAGEPEGSKGGRAVSDVMWKCRKCKSLLGFYDIEEDVLRIRYKDQVTFIKVGGADVDKMAEAATAVGAVSGVSPEVVVAMMSAVAEFMDPGLVQVVCRHCSAVNTQHYSPEAGTGE